jgi:hypothetical protein
MAEILSDDGMILMDPVVAPLDLELLRSRFHR